MTFFKSLSKYQIVFIIALILFFPAYFINLGMLPFIDDEGIRGLVALEMKLSGDYVTPTLSGALYFKKPPLYNWIILGFFEMSGQYNEFWLRVPAVLSIFFFTLTIYFVLRKEVSEKIAIITSLMFLTCGRIIIYESLHGLIDLCYSWLTYISFITVYKLYKRNRLLLLFVLVYFISAITYLMKGLPTIVFTGITLLTFFIWKQKFKLLFHWKHFLGIGIFLLFVGGYYFIYFLRNPIPVNELFEIVFNESARRTGIRFGLWQTILHFFTFPFEQIYHFLPWSLFIVFFIRKDFLERLKENEFIHFSAIIFLFNIMIYWVSVEVFARYVLMLVPLAYTVFAYFHEIRSTNQQWLHNTLVNLLFPITIGVILIAFLFAPFIFTNLKLINWFLFKLILISIGITTVFIFFMGKKTLRIPLFIVFMLIFKMGFNWFIVPQRNEKDIKSRELAKDLGNAYQNKKLLSYWNNSIDPNPYYGKIITQYNFLFYVTAASQQILHQTSDIREDSYYMVHEKHFKEQYFEPLDTILPAGNSKPVYICKPVRN